MTRRFSRQYERSEMLTIQADLQTALHRVTLALSQHCSEEQRQELLYSLCEGFLNRIAEKADRVVQHMCENVIHEPDGCYICKCQQSAKQALENLKENQKNV